MIRNSNNSYIPSSDDKNGMKLKIVKYTNKQKVTLIVLYENVMGTITIQDNNTKSIENHGELFKPLLHHNSIDDISMSSDEQLIAAYCLCKKSHVSLCNCYEYVFINLPQV